jgi:carbamoyltransferase
MVRTRPDRADVRVIGLSGGSTPTRPLPSANRDHRLPAAATMFHDSAAVLIRGGTIVAAIEEERLNRLKHTNCLAVQAIRACLRRGGLSIGDIDRLAYYGKEDGLDRLFAGHMLRNPHIPARWSARTYLSEALSADLGCEVDPSTLTFVEHHLAHAASAFAMSAFDDALVVTLDGQGDGRSSTVWVGERGRLRRLLDIPDDESLGLLYFQTLGYLGYGAFDEYKVMGLAPYGDPAVFGGVFDDICALQPKGRWAIQWERLHQLRDTLPPVRRAWEPIEDVHRNLAAAVQAAVERATFHLLRYYREETGLQRLCLAGGVAHNSTMIGKIARSGLFDAVFTQPAAHDAGCALGAAIVVHQELAPDVSVEPCTHVYWGLDLDDGVPVATRVSQWSSSDLVVVRRPRDLMHDVAALLADGAVIGWVQGRAEFGPRALGNRSILADPRPAAHRAKINALVKSREDYRPFAPAVLEEYAHEWFEMPDGACADFMTLTVFVRSAMRDRLAAVTHIDGTARVQTVSRRTNERFWRLIDAFRALTGVPVLLNTSFNHSIEPIVDSVDDAMTCFLTTGLTHLVVDEYLVTMRPMSPERIMRLAPDFPDHVRLIAARQVSGDGRLTDLYQCEHTVVPQSSHDVSEAMFQLLRRADGVRTIAELLEEHDTPVPLGALTSELIHLWRRRLIRLRPGREVLRTEVAPAEVISQSTP